MHPLNANAFVENTFSTTVSDGLKALHKKYREDESDRGVRSRLHACQDPDVANAKEWVCPVDCREHQQFVFKEQILLAKEMNLPLVVHARDAYGTRNRIVWISCGNTVTRAQKIHVHCFTGTTSFAQELLQSFPNLKLGFTGVCTFKTVRTSARLFE